MTRSYLDLSIAIGRPADVLALLRECRRLLGTPGEVPAITSRTESPLLPSGRGHVSNALFWDFPASLSIGYGIDGPMTELPPDDASERHRRSLAENPVSNGWAAIEVSLKPFIGWSEISPGATDHDLGAWLIRELGRWLDARRLPWQWEANGASTYLPYSTGPTCLPKLGDASAGAVTPETAIRVTERYLPDWLRRWDGPSQGEGTVLEGWQS
ncbi:hypothetical protein [Amycolatopsis sp. NPDC004079]|uniref:hypothetical protein n=1 Tax=Amycolatopsis sp. NPDC004079 TaxID=3154549 RepID=UPI0033AE1728